MSIERFEQALGNPNVQAFLKMLRYGEGTSGPKGYVTMFGGELFDSFDAHPNRVVTKTLGGKPISSSAAGAYQFLARTWKSLVDKYGFTDFSPHSQDLAAVALIAGRGALDDVIEGRFGAAVAKCNREWASLPGSPYGQPTVTLDKARQLYVTAGGSFDDLSDPIAALTTPPTPIALPTPSPEQKDPAMAPFIAAAVTSVIDAVPDLIKIFGSKEDAVAERNSKAAIRVVEVAKDAIGAVNEQELVERIESEPAAAEQVRLAVQAQWYELTTTAESVAAAREANAVYTRPDAPSFTTNPAFWISLIVFIFPFMLLVDFLFVHPAQYSDEIRTQIVTAILVCIGVGSAYWLGSTNGSARKTELLDQRR